MELLADTHLHLYPCFDLDRAFSGLLDRLAAADAQAPRFGCLAERADCHFYARLLAGEELLHDFSIETAGSRQFVLRRQQDGSRLTLLPGRQIIAAEKIEVLAVCTDALFADGVPAAELIRSILKKDGVPVLPWSPGKWFFRRGKVIASLLRSFTPQDFLIGDVSLRPWGWPLPLLMRKARRLGFQIVSGSDPLPFPGEEQLSGCYGTKITADCGAAAPDEALRLLLSGQAAAASFGRRSSPLELFRRLRYNSAIRRQEKRCSVDRKNT